MIWKTIILLSVALCVLGDGHHAISEQRIKIIHKEHHKEHHKEKEVQKEKEKVHSGHHGELSHIGSKKPEHHDEYAWSYPSYEFSYKVHDPHSHDMKGQKESREGDSVKGEYWLVQPDGRKRVVTYHADKHSGFHAIVHYSDEHHHDDHKKEENAGEEEGNSEEGGEQGDDGGEGGEGGEAQGGEGDGNENAAEEGKEEEKEEESGRKEEVGRWIHDRHWGHYGGKKHHDRHHDDDKHHHGGDDRRREEHKKPERYYGHHIHRMHKHEDGYNKDIGSMSILEGLGSYGSRHFHERAEWHGHDKPVREEHYEESRRDHREYEENRAHPSHKSGAIVRENYFHPRYYRHSQQKKFRQ
ncbi:uncharacterized protein LOC142973069 isoform X2 [Anticarsia gemmatalis]|uniref:uncharacterized protein LOC142973069 isoform X2 n=1 Tax=Anticarsia gemmatalis TaxID=129554 RepID=UPI003F75F7A3